VAFGWRKGINYIVEVVISEDIFPRPT